MSCSSWLPVIIALRNELFFINNLHEIRASGLHCSEWYRIPQHKLSDLKDETMSAMRMAFLAVAAVIMLGIWLTGFNTVHWVLYLPVAALTFAGITGICQLYDFP
jgi:hypothetical protein